MGSPYPHKLLTDDPNELVIHSSSLELVNPLYDDSGLDHDDKLFDNAKLLRKDQVQLLQQSWEDTTNEITADAFLNWVYHCNTGGVFGFTNSDDGKDWQEFMNWNMRTWIRNAIVHNALRENSNLPFFLAHDKIRGFVGLATVGGYNEVIVRTEPSTVGGNSTMDRDALTQGDEVAVIGQAVGEIDGEDGSWTAIIWNGTKRWVATFLLESADNVPPPEDPFLDFDGGFSRARDWQFFFDLVAYLDNGAGNDS